ncbi:EGF domain-specific O-linked N-acetylglucosamine transferase [Mycena sanguinolenta]|uniref:EGF domain-specific O-linked N-acetylglucosamine transferase n=1 Tax=Mycena sanguinolenta TaxID=230812 RepID=A0A8H6ZHZ1_9AGAR|nr:EGF domain-specific O-linked N-acetylglucosamine transferase [Mycena sanguinolenta]
MVRTRYFSFGSRNARIILLFTLLVVVPPSLVGYYNHRRWLKWRVDSISPPSLKPTPTSLPWAYGWTLTTIPSGTHVPGFTLLDHLYLRNGTFYVVTSDRASFPPRENLLSRPVETVGGDWVDTEPTDEASVYIFSTFCFDVVICFYSSNCGSSPPGRGTRGGFTVIVYDPPELMKDYFHWFGEVILGAWRVYSHISPDEPDMSSDPPKHLPLPRCFILPFMDRGDLAGTHGPLMRVAFPYVTIERSDYWDDLKRLDTTVVFDRVMLVNRHAATHSPSGGVPWSSSMIAGAMNVTVPPNFWAAVRSTLWRGVLYYKYVPDMVMSPQDVEEYGPVCTYISRQEGFDRRLSAADHDGLIEALREVHAEALCNVRVVTLERMTLRE